LPRLAKAHRAEGLVVIFDQTDAAHHKCAHNISRDGGREKRTHHTSNVVGLNVDGVEMIGESQELSSDCE
jgi:hypothetical protein